MTALSISKLRTIFIFGLMVYGRKYLQFAIYLLAFLTTILLVSYLQQSNTPLKVIASNMTKLVACDFEVFGIVQGVFFRKYTINEAKKLGLRGWCMNTRDGTVKGQLEGEVKPVEEMKHWLQTKGSPTSRIDKAVFSEMREIGNYTFETFSLKR